MGRGPKPAKGKVEAKSAVSRKSPKNDRAKVRDLEERLAEALGQLQTRNRELAESQEQQTATSEILRVIASSSTDVRPVFEAILKRAATLCEAQLGHLWLYEGGEQFRLGAGYGSRPGHLQWLQQGLHRFGQPLFRESGPWRVGQILDVRDTEPYRRGEPVWIQTADHEGMRTLLGVPLVKDGRLVGSIAVYRREVQSFTDQQTALVQTFADQAVIAIENVRLFTELQAKNDALTTAHAQTTEALEQQTATSEILRVISSSPTDVNPVFRTILANANRLCDASFSVLWLWDGEAPTAVAHENVSPAMAEALRTARPLPNRRHPLGLSILEQTVVHVADVLTDTRFTPEDVPTYRLEGARSIVAVPMVREGGLVGVINAWRREQRLFSDGQIALLKTFADQAVIAIENVRLFRELEARNRDLTEALEQQTATSDILKVISSSPTDTQPVFDAIAANAARLCNANDAQVLRVEGEELRLVAAVGAPAMPAVRPLTRGYLVGRAVIDRQTIHVRDLAQALAEYPETSGPRFGTQSALAVPLLREGVAHGVIRISRTEIRPFTDKQIALLQTFADQAVIAIENVRLFTELQEKNRALTETHAQVSEALEQQTATSEILRVISGSPADVQPVFEKVVEQALRLLGGLTAAVVLVRDGVCRLGAFTALGEAADVAMRHMYPRALTELPLAESIVRDGTARIIDDAQSDERMTQAAWDAARARGYRSLIMVPLIRDGVVAGTINVSHRGAGAFGARHIALLQTFADQAVIAIENVRLFKELEARNRDLTATSEILQVISRSPTDTQPVFEAIAESAGQLIGAVGASVYEFDGTLIHLRTITPAAWPHAEALRGQYPRPPQLDLAAGRVILEGTILHSADIEADPTAPPLTRQLAQQMGLKGVLWVPMLREGAPVGAIGVIRAAPGLFSDEQVRLLQTFADQAAIAIENVRLFKELETRNRDLSEALDKQTATSEILRAISRSQIDVQAVFDIIVESAVRLLRGFVAAISRLVDNDLHLVAFTRTDPDGDAAVRSGFPQPLASDRTHARVVRDRTLLNVADAQSDPQLPEAIHALAVVRGYQSLVVVPLLRHDEAIGAISVTRREPGGFTVEEISLLQTFADQAVIAIENVRLFNELESVNRDLAAASQHKSEFLANMSHELRTPLNAVIGFSEVLSEGMFGQLNEKQEEYARDIYSSGQHLLSLINDILDLSKIEAGRMELELTDFDLPTAIENALILVRERAGRGGISVEARVDERLGQIQADERKIRQVVLNLLSNAIKFTPEGGRIDVEARPRDESVEISVTDTGIGIAPEDQEAVFEEFRQVGRSDKKAEGTGLGLTLCRKFIELHGGRIWVKSQLGVGSTFTFTVPTHHGPGTMDRL